MKILAINGSHRKGGNTEILLKEALGSCQKAGAEIELIQLADMKIEYCAAHGSDFCKNEGCIYKDGLEEIFGKMVESGAIIVGSPVYMGSVTGKLKTFMDRSVILRRKNFSLKNKVGAAVAVGGCQGGGQEYVIRDIHNFFLIHSMTVVSDGVDTAHFGVTGVGGGVGDVRKDKAALEVARNLGKRVVEELRLRSG
ncbi:MAG: flavodoxin family protein [Candidatus Dojkabacteria bacterium]|jgi:multimeric flavodoxin WrbA|nr:flavodoxin family protein [Candidatus Dojkabacteria bacterium]